MGLFQGKVALVTGGGSGIGRATAIAFAREGARVVIASRRVVQGEETISLIRDRGGEAIFVKTDVSESAQVEAMLTQTINAFGRLDCAFNNAGIVGPEARMHQYTENDWDDVITTNLKGIWLCMQHEIQHMLENGGGAIVNNSSAAGKRSWPRHPAYVASKHGVVGLTRNTSREYAKDGIRVNAVCPGWIDTPMLDFLFEDVPERREKISTSQPMERMGTPGEVSEAVLWLCSERSSYINGECLMVDGGQTT